MDCRYRVVRTKMVFVGSDSDINLAVAKAKKVPSQGGTGVQPLPVTTARPFVSVTPAPSIVVSSPGILNQIMATPISFKAKILQQLIILGSLGKYRSIRLNWNKHRAYSVSFKRVKLNKSVKVSLFAWMDKKIRIYLIIC